MQGSSPLARGLRHAIDVPPSRGRIIPARAGFTDISFQFCHRLQDHPRSRGVYEEDGRFGGAPHGSSPLARGLRDNDLHGRFDPGIIPARAGFTRVLLIAQIPSQDHPRSRGVYGAPARRSGRLLGSSPLARGLRASKSRHSRRSGIIPARAGFTLFFPWFLSLTTDHPRSRGVYSHSPRHSASIIGSSPLARGLPWPGIPRLCASRDHPRSRGVY